MPPWQVESIEDMATDLDGSLSGLGVDLTTASYNMSETLLLPSLNAFKQEAPSPSADNLLQQNRNIGDQSGQTSTLQHLLQQHPFGSHGSNNNTHVSTFDKKNTASVGSSLTETHDKKCEDRRFQYILAAATSIATKVTEEPLTYLNQGQSYEIKLKKVGELSNYRGKVLKSIIHICFHERRMQFMEREQILAWQASRPGERIVELDIPLSYGVFEVNQDQTLLNTLSFLWDPTKEVGAYIKVNCISTEFTPKKHGGEKGVPFRIQVETYLQGDETRLHAAACQIKVFKLKGADRKHKQDREKILKRPLSEQDKYQPSYECTVLNDLPPDAVFPAPLPLSSPMLSVPGSRLNSIINPIDSSSTMPLNNGRNSLPCISRKGSQPRINEKIGNGIHTPMHSPTQMLVDDPILHLNSDSTCDETAQWLQENSFENYMSIFVNFNGSDLLRLTREDLIQICGLPDGIRLLYALHSKAIVRLTIYICTPCSGAYHALYLDSMSRIEICRKIAALVGVDSNRIQDLFLQGPNGIHIVVTDEVVTHLKDESLFTLDVLKDESRDRFQLLLKPVQSS